jgi:hypothetical protein
MDMSFDSFFKNLVTVNPKREEKTLCNCRHPINGQLIKQADGSFTFIGECKPEKACFKIHLDAIRSSSKNWQVLVKVSPKKRKEWEKRPTLDEFFSEDYISRINKRDIPKPPPPHNVDNPSDS